MAAGIDMPAIMQAGSWKNPERVARYSDHLLVKRGGMAQLAACSGADQAKKLFQRNPTIHCHYKKLSITK